jgi:hypothetical protein
MNKEEFTKRIIEAGRQFEVVSIRIHKDRKYGLDIQTYSLWAVGEHSKDETLCMGKDCYSLLIKFRSLEKAVKISDKFKKWLSEIK